ncbi:MAG: hypothetical protein V1926_04305 [Candidatus Peregrinibacteria bacterium]
MLEPLAAIFSTVGLFYGMIIPFIVILLLVAFLIPSLLVPGTKAGAVLKATVCYLMMGIGVLLMTIAVLPTIASVFAGISYPSGTYVGLLILFLTGGFVFITYDRAVATVDPLSRSVPFLIYFSAFKIIGRVTVVLAFLSIVLTFSIGNAQEQGWWLLPVTALLYGLLLTWCTREKAKSAPVVRPPLPVMPPPAKKMIAQRPPMRRKK